MDRFYKATAAITDISRRLYIPNPLKMLTPPFESPFPPVYPQHVASSACCVAAVLYINDN